jgi:hypothetical protein
VCAVWLGSTVGHASRGGLSKQHMPALAYGSNRHVGQARTYSPSHMFGAPDLFAKANRSASLRGADPKVSA